MSLQTLQEQKSQLRREVRANLAKLSADEIKQQSTSITQKVLSLEGYQTAKSISIFLAMPGKEVETRDIVVNALRCGKLVYVPYIYVDKGSGSKQKVMEMLQLRDEHDFNSLQPDSWGIPSLDAESVSHRNNALGGLGIEPAIESRGASTPQLDLIFMPAVAFDHTHHRLGHGKGFYDRYLERLKNLTDQSGNSMPALVGLALQQQLLSPARTVPVDERDWIVERVITSGPSI